MAKLSPRAWGYPVVPSTSERNVLFATPTLDQRVHNKETGRIERYDGVQWVVDFESTEAMLPGDDRTNTTFSSFIANNLGTVYNVLDYMVGGVSFSDALIAIYSKVSDGDTVRIPAGSYTAAGQLTCAKKIILDASGVTITFPTSIATMGLKFTAAPVIYGPLNVVGPQVVDYDSDVFCEDEIAQNGVYVNGTVSAYLEGVVLEHVIASGWGGAGILLEFCKNPKLNFCESRDNYHYGIVTLSCAGGGAFRCVAEDIRGDGVAGTNAYGFLSSKHNGTLAENPVSRDFTYTECVARRVVTWEGFDTHGGINIRYVNCDAEDCRSPLNIGYDDTVGSEASPERCQWIGGSWRITGDVAIDGVQRASVVGSLDAELRGLDNVVDGVTIDGYGNTDVSPGQAGSGALEAQYQDRLTVRNIRGNSAGHHLVLVKSCNNSVVDGVDCGTLAGDVATAPTGTITFSVNPSDGDTITLNSKVITFKNSVADATSQVEVGADLATTLASAVTMLNGSLDGRLSLCTYSANSTVLTITSDTAGRALNDVYTLAASVATVSAASLQGGTTGAAVVHVAALTGGPVCANSKIKNITGNGTYTVVQSVSDHPTVHYENIRNNGTGPRFDCRGSSAVPQSGTGDIDLVAVARATRDLASIAAGASETFYIPMPGVSTAMDVTITPSRNLAGLVATAQAANNYTAVEVTNPTGSAIDLASATWTARARKSVASTVNV